MTRRSAILLAPIAVACLTFAGLLRTGALGANGSRAADDFGLLAAIAIAMWVTAVASRRASGRLRAGWAVLSAAMATSALGQLGSTATDFGLGQDLADQIAPSVCFVLATALTIGATFLLSFHLRRPAAVVMTALDGLLITTSLMYVTVALVFDQAHVATGVPRVALLAGLAYPAGDVAMCAIAVLALSRAPGEMRATLAALLGGFVAFAVSDGLHAAGAFYQSGTPIDTGWLAGYLLIAFAATLQQAERNPDVNETEGAWTMAIPYVAPALSLAVAVGVFWRGLSNPPLLRIFGLATVAVAMTGLIVHRVDLVRLLKRSQAAERTLDRNREMLDRLLDTAPAALFSFDRQGRVLLARGHAPGFAGNGAVQEGRGIQDLISPFPAAAPAVARALAGQTSAAGMTVGSSEMELMCTPVFAPDGRVQSVSGIILDVTAQRRLQREIAENEAKSQLLATVSHELRTPLNSILGFAHLIEQERAGSLTEKQRRYIGHVQTSGRHLLRLINSILDFSKLAAGGELDVELASVEAIEAVAVAVEEVRPLAGDRSVAVPAGAHRCCVRADPVRLQQILLNLLANAIQCTAANGNITVDCRRVAGATEISVADDGIGITSGDMERIFERYEQGSNLGPGHSGTGLGLQVSRHLAQQMGGSLSVESVTGGGSTFKLRLPAA
jgi:signal transduction histidine kinase